MRTLGAALAGLRALTRMIWPRMSYRMGFHGRLGDERDYAGMVGDGTGSPLVMACISWIVNAFTSMRPVVVAFDVDETSAAPVPGHPAARLFRRPTFDPTSGRSAYSWLAMIVGVIISLIADGNGYLYKVRGAGGFGKPVQLWYVPHWALEPKWIGPDYITYYDYSPDNGTTHYAIDPGDIIHIRLGIDPSNTRKGLSKLKPLLREIYTDEEAARWTAALLRNYGVPGAVIAPEFPLTDEDDAEDVKAEFRMRFTGDNRGMPVVLRGPTKVTPYGFSPDQMKLGDIRDIPEERVSAAIGVPAAVVGFGAGLQSTKVGATMAELVDLAWQHGVLPLARTIAAELTEQLLPELEPGAGTTHEFEFDTSRVPIMADHQKKIAEIVKAHLESTAYTRADARRRLGLPVGPRDEVYILGSGMTEADATKKPEPPALPAPAAAPALGPGAEPAAIAAAFARALEVMAARDGAAGYRTDMERMARAIVESGREMAAAIASRGDGGLAEVTMALVGARTAGTPAPDLLITKDVVRDPSTQLIVRTIDRVAVAPPATTAIPATTAPPATTAIPARTTTSSRRRK